MVGKKNKNLTKYLQETRKVWTDGKPHKQKGLPGHMFILDIYDDSGELTHHELFDSICEQTVEILHLNTVLHQIDIIRLRNEMDQLESEIHESRKRMNKLWKPIKYIITGVVISLILLLGSCSNDHHDPYPVIYQVTDIHMQDSVIHKNILDDILGIPTRNRTYYKYEITLSDIEHVQPDTTMTIQTGSKITPDDFIGVQICNGYIYDTK